jgi:hypothetical protein
MCVDNDHTCGCEGRYSGGENFTIKWHVHELELERVMKNDFGSCGDRLRLKS